MTDSINILHERIYGYKRPMLRNDRYDDDRNYLKKQICSYANALGSEHCGNLKEVAEIGWFLSFKRKAEVEIELLSGNENKKVSTVVNGKSLISTCSRVRFK